MILWLMRKFADYSKAQFSRGLFELDKSITVSGDPSGVELWAKPWAPTLTWRTDPRYPRELATWKGPIVGTRRRPKPVLKVRLQWQRSKPEGLGFESQCQQVFHCWSPLNTSPTSYSLLCTWLQCMYSFTCEIFFLIPTKIFQGGGNNSLIVVQ